MHQLIDCHVHTRRCGHAIGTTSDYLAAARRVGVSAVVMTEHLALPEGLDPNGGYSMALDEIHAYVDEVARATALHPQLDVVIGAEADWIPSRASETRRIRAEARDAGVTVLLGSVHFIDGWAFDDPALVDEWDTRDILGVWESYFELWCAAVESGEFEVMAHPDLVKKFGHRPEAGADRLYAQAADAARAAGVIVEISTAGLRKPVRELYPGTELLDAFCRAGVPVTIGSDAHAPDELGYRLDVAYAAAAQVGYTEVRLPLGPGQSRSIPL